MKIAAHYINAFKAGKIRLLNLLNPNGTVCYALGFIIDSSDINEQIKSVASNNWARDVTDFEVLPISNSEKIQGDKFAITMDDKCVIVQLERHYLISPFDLIS